MSELRKEIERYIDILPDSRLEALKPILMLLVSDAFTVETDLTNEERAVIAEGRKAYARGEYIPLDAL